MLISNFRRGSIKLWPSQIQSTNSIERNTDLRHVHFLSLKFFALRHQHQSPPDQTETWTSEPRHTRGWTTTSVSTPVPSCIGTLVARTVHGLWPADPQTTSLPLTTCRQPPERETPNEPWPLGLSTPGRSSLCASWLWSVVAAPGLWFSTARTWCPLPTSLLYATGKPLTPVIPSNRHPKIHVSHKHGCHDSNEA